MSQQPEALRLADALNEKPDSDGHCREAATNLRRLHEVNQELLEALKGVLEVFAKPHNETLLEVIAARAAIAKGEQK